MLTQLLIATAIGLVCAGLGLADWLRGRAGRAADTARSRSARPDWVSRSIVSR